MSYKLPDSSLLPSTPNSRSYKSHPSTTPAAPPPEWLQHPSTTPAVPPPRSIFGSSYLAGGTFPRGTGSALKSFTLPESSPPPFEEEDHDDNDAASHQLIDLYDQDNGLLSSVMSTRGLKRSRDGQIQPQRESRMPTFARAIVDRNKMPTLRESDTLILGTEHVVSTIDSAAQNLDMQDPEEAMTSAVEELTSIWQEKQPIESREGAIGPVSDSPVAQASYIASFLLSLHHPYISSTTRSPAVRNRPTASAPVPQALLSWLNAYHNPFVDDFDSVHLFQPSPAANESFWDLIFSSLLRGKLDRVIRLLRDAGWEHAATALDDGATKPGYSGKQYQNTRDSVEKCVNVLLSCPAVRYGNWDVKGQEWALFRQEVRSALHELEAFAEGGKDTSSYQTENIFSQSARGSQSLSSVSRRAESRIPWTIYDNLRTLYAHLQGSIDEIILVSQDWLEASIYLTVWWDGDDGSENLTRSTIRKGGQHSTREVDITPLRAYRQRLTNAFALVTKNPQDAVFIVDTSDTTQVGIACAMEGAVGSVIEILGSLSLPIASAVADIAALNEWLPQGRATSGGLLEQGFDQDDLLVLSRDSEALPGDVDRDSLLASYADLLAKKQLLRSAEKQRDKQGWELAAAVLGRMTDRQPADSKITTLFDRVDMKDDLEAARVCSLCSDLGLFEQARRLSERYADTLSEGSQRYGAMLIFYARAHASQKVVEISHILISLCLVQSTAMPPATTLDDKLASLLAPGRPGLTELAQLDAKAAADLAAQLSGYATLRKFYELRDLHLSTTARINSLDCRRQALKCLLAAVTSAADCIRGGLFDATVSSVIPAKSLLVLLGEVLPFCGQKTQALSQAQIFTLLRVVEDYAASPDRTRQAAEEFLKTCVSSGTPAALHKSNSNTSSASGLGVSSYDLLETSSLLLKQSNGQGAPIARAWDWKCGLSGLGGSDNNAQSLLLLLRVALARLLSYGQDS